MTSESDQSRHTAQRAIPLTRNVQKRQIHREKMTFVQVGLFFCSGFSTRCLENPNKCFGQPSWWCWPTHNSVNIPKTTAFHAVRVKFMVYEWYFKKAVSKKDLSLFHFLWVVKFNKPNNSLYGGQEAIVRTGQETTDCKSGEECVKAAYRHLLI